MQTSKYPVYMIEFDNDPGHQHFVVSEILFYEIKNYIEGLPE